MSKQVLTIDLATGKRQLETVIDNQTNAAGRADMAYSAEAVDGIVSAINSGMEATITELKQNESYQNTVVDIADATNQVKSYVDGARYAIGNTIQIYHDGNLASGTVGQPGYIPPVAPYWETCYTILNGTRVVKLVDNKEYQFDGAKWIEVASLLSYQNAVNYIATDIATASKVNGARYAIGNTIKVYTAPRSASGTPGQPGYIPYSSELWTTIGTVTAGARVVNLSDSKEYQFDGTNWVDPFENDGRFVYTTKDQTIDGKKEFVKDTTFDQAITVNGTADIKQDLNAEGNVTIAKNLTVAGDLLVAGTTTQIDTENLVVKDNIITLNDGDLGTNSGTGITTGAAGIEINRGTNDGTSTGTVLPKAKLIYNESTGTFQAGLEGDLKDLGVINDAAEVDSLKETYSASKINSMVDNLSTAITNSSLFTYVASQDVTSGQILAIDSDGRVYPADCTNTNCMDKIAGVCFKTTTAGTVTAVAKFGKVSRFGGLTSGEVYFLGTNGNVTDVCPSTSGSFICKVGASVNDSTILLQIGEAILIS